MIEDGNERGRREPQLLAMPDEHLAVFAAVVDSALDAVIIVDEEGAVVAMNPAAEVTFGYTRQEALGRPIGELIVPAHLQEAHEQGMARYRLTHEPRVLGRRVEMEARRKDGCIIPVELAITEVNLSDERRFFTANLRDLSAARAAAAEIEHQRETLRRSEKLAAFGSLLASIAHELNNPLSIVLGQAAMLREEAEGMGENATISTRAASIKVAAERCARVVRSFLTIVRQGKAEQRALAIAPILDGSIELLDYGFRSSGVQVTRDYDGPLPDIFADPDQVQQIFANLLVNAAQALEDIEGHREIRIRAQVGPDDTLRIVISDNGPGIDGARAERIFDPFFTTKAQGVGTGIGLSISRGLAEAQGGRLSLLASPEGGAAFELSLPLATEQATTADAGGTAVVPGVADGTTPRALVIDDEAEIAELIAVTLRQAGYQCDVATGGRQAQELMGMHGEAYDAVICDLRMPDLDGPALLRWTEKHYPALVERTLFLTGDALGPAAGRFLAESGRPVLEKPFAFSDILRIVAELRLRGD